MTLFTFKNCGIDPKGSCAAPWKVSINANNAFCGGSLISDSWIVTKAHCVKDTPIHEISVNFPCGLGEYHVDRLELYPNSNPVRNINDIAVIRLEKNGPNEHMTSICLPPLKNQAEVVDLERILQDLNTEYSDIEPVYVAVQDGFSGTLISTFNGRQTLVGLMCWDTGSRYPRPTYMSLEEFIPWFNTVMANDKE
ncbi:urokinase-type plasminogen activator-like [Anastrepha obliqua]|uniref:urokinase-type plasminogen activator-like n=1 Tax=Anastrepha obliqua TaxID=95512 RepID=UPI0024092218|nr:urokinase-type plasminogen activator-like [Anastrepha obliqua]